MQHLRRPASFVGAVLVMMALYWVVRPGYRKAHEISPIDLVALAYTPGITRPSGQAPLQQLRRIGNEWSKQQKQHIPLRFLSIPELGPSGETWALTRLMGGVAPEIMSAGTKSVFFDRAADWYVDLTPYLSKPNPYVPGNEAWADLFHPGVLEEWRSAVDSRIYCLPIDQVEVAVFYNKDILRRCGIAENEIPPATWDEFIAIQRRIAAAGETPFLMTGGTSLRIRFIYQILFDMLNDDRFDQINVVATVGERTPAITEQELVRAIKRKILGVHDPRYLEAWRIIRQWSELWQKGFLGTSELTAFRRGKAAMTLDGSWLVSTLKSDRNLGFEYGIFLVPPITRATSQYATGAPARGVGGAAAVQWCLTKETTARKGNLDACIDSLMYLTAPQNCGPMVAEAESFLPAIIGAEFSPDLLFMKPLLAIGNVRVNAIDRMTARARDEWWSTMQYYLEGSYSEDDVTRVMAAVVDREMRELLELRKDTWQWKTDSQGAPLWEIAPSSRIHAMGEPAREAGVQQ